ncbi:MAG: prenyltransferase/squalene oxidase repeat-containing protein, partial [Pirellula sp.]
MIRDLFLATSLVAVLFVCATPAPVASAEQYDPEHPFVMNLVKKGVEFLKGKGSETQGNVGHDIIIAMAIYKSDPEENGGHPVVTRGIQQAIRVGQRMNADATHWEHEDMYIVPVAAMLLASVSPDKYKDVLLAMRDALITSQRPNGGFGYMNEGPYKASGAADISQTQYIMLAFWTMHQAGIEVPPEAVIRCIDLLARAQSGDGGWPYQWGVNLPNNVVNRSPTSSLTAAGFSAFLIAGDTIGAFRSKFAGAQEEEGIVPE